MSKVTDLCNEIAEKIPKVCDKKYDEGFVAGKNNEYDSFWRAYQAEGTRTNYTNGFRSFCWTDSCYNPKYPIVTDQIGNMYNASVLTDTKVPITHKGVTNVSSVFSGASRMHTIRTLTVAEATTFASWFTNCTNLQNITFEGTIGKDINFKDSPLTKASIESVMSHVSATATLTVTFKKTAVDTAFETSEGAADGSISEEWLALVDAKPNCTVSLV